MNDYCRSLFCFLLMLGSFLHGQVKERYLYQPDITYGSTGYFSPLTAFVNGSCDILRNTWDTRRITKIQYDIGVRNVLSDLWNAPEIIEDYNNIPKHNFWKEQVLPMDFSSDRAPWFPNYLNHTIGEGLICRQIAEYYKVKGVRFPYALAVLNTAAFQFTNEVIEASFGLGPSVDPIPDLLLFNPLGWLLFYFDGPARFMGQKLHFCNWSLQPMFNPVNQVVSNAGEQYVVKLDLPRVSRVQALFGWGIDGTVGACYQSSSGLNFSLAGGLKARRLKASIEQKQSVVYPELEPNVVLYVDRRESLLFSLNQVGMTEPNLILNVYPGARASIPFGLYAGWNSYLGTHVGISWKWLPIGFFAGR